MWQVLSFLVFYQFSSLGNAQFRSGLFFPQVKAQQQQSCIVSHNQQRGVCQPLSQCPPAQQHLSHVRPTICAFDRLEPIVCCDIPFQQRLPQGQRGKRISVKKCEETYLRVSKFVPTIVGGIAARPGEFSHAAAIGWYQQGGEINYNCGGFLISPWFVITAAHCTRHGNVAPNVVRIGGGNLEVKRSTDAVVEISQIYAYPSYRSNEAYHDIAIFKLAQRILYHTPACLWTGKIANNVDVTAIGYGHTEYSGPKSTKLLKTTLKIFPNSVCSPYYQRDSYLPYGVSGSQLCVGDPAKTRDTCQGDSGGPILIKRNVRKRTIPYVVGITSIGQGCAGQAPSIYTKIASYLDWIESIVWPNEQ